MRWIDFGDAAKRGLAHLRHAGLFATCCSDFAGQHRRARAGVSREIWRQNPVSEAAPRRRKSVLHPQQYLFHSRFRGLKRREEIQFGVGPRVQIICAKMQVVARNARKVIIYWALRKSGNVPGMAETACGSGGGKNRRISRVREQILPTEIRRFWPPKGHCEPIGLAPFTRCGRRKTAQPKAPSRCGQHEQDYENLKKECEQNYEQLDRKNHRHRPRHPGCRSSGCCSGRRRSDQHQRRSDHLRQQRAGWSAR